MVDGKGKGLWADIVRGTAAGAGMDAEASAVTVRSIQDGMKDKLVLNQIEENLSSKNGLDSPSKSSSASNPPLLDTDPGSERFTDGNGVLDGGDSNSESTLEGSPMPASPNLPSPKPRKVAWTKPLKPLIDSGEGAVMGAESWPSLDDSRTMKNVPLARLVAVHNSADAYLEKEVASTSFSAQQKTEANIGSVNVHLGHRKSEVIKDYAVSSTAAIPDPSSVVSDAVPAGAFEQVLPTNRVNNAAAGNSIGIGRGRMPIQRGNYGNVPENTWAPHPRNRKGSYSGRSGVAYQPQSNSEIRWGPGEMHNQSGVNGFYPRQFRAPRQSRGYGFNHANRRPYVEQGRGPNNWQPQQFFANGLRPIPPFPQPFFDPRSSTWGVPNVFPPGVGFFNHQGPEGMYHPPIGIPGFPAVTPYYDHLGALQMLPPFALNTTVEQLLAKQIEYYFSDENLLRDAFLRSKMDAEGFVPASLIASFNKIRMLNADTNMILNALRNSSIVEVQGEKLRRRNNGPMWPLPPNHHATSSSSESGSSHVEANDSYPTESRAISEPLQATGGSTGVTQEISLDNDVHYEPSVPQSAALIVDRVESDKILPSAANVELEGDECTYENNGFALHPNSDVLDKKR